MAVTTLQNCTKKGVLTTLAFPVASGESIYQGSLAYVNDSGYLANLTAAVAATGSVNYVGFVKDGSENNNATAPSANGSISGDDEKGSSLSNGEKTIRQLWTQGQFKITTASGLSQASVGRTVYATDNFTFNVTGDGVAIGSLTEYIAATTGYVDLNTYYGDAGTKLYRGAVTAATTTTGGDAISFTFGKVVYLQQFDLDITTAATGVAAMDIGVAANGTTSSDTLIDGIDVGSAAIYGNPYVDGGTNGAAPRKLTATQYVTGTPSATLAGLVGTFVAVYVEA